MRSISGEASERGLNADRMPDRLELEEGGDLPRGLDVRGAAMDALDAVRREPLELSDLAVGAGEVERVDVDVRCQPRRELGTMTGHHVDRTAGNVGRRDRFAQLDRRERMRLGREHD